MPKTDAVCIAKLEKLVQDAKKAQELQQANETKGEVRIVVLQRGWVVVGFLSKATKDEMVLTRAAVIRNWGTTKGLPQLVSGPIEGKTVLDKSATPIRFHPLTVVLMLDGEKSKWQAAL